MARRRQRRKARGLTTAITRKQALSYTRAVPNPLGVTTLAEINGKNAYRRRYRATAEMLGGGAMRRKKKVGSYYANAVKRARRRRRMRRNFEGAGSFAQPATPLRSLASRVARAQRRAAKKSSAPASRRRKKTAGRRKGRKLTKAQRAAISRRNLKKAHKALGRKAGGKRKKRKASKKSRRRAVVSVRPLYARIGGKSKRTYLRRTKRGVGRLPIYRSLGYRSLAAMKKAQAAGGKSFFRRMDSVRRRRASAAARAQKQILEGRGLYSMFTPNTGAVPYEEWKSMTANARKKRKKKGRKGRKVSAKQRAAARRNIKKAQAALRRKGGGKKRKKARKKGRRRSTAKQRAAAKRNLKKARAAQRRKARGGAPKKRRRSGGKRGRRRSASKRLTITMRANKRGRRKRKSSRRRRRGPVTRSITLYAQNRRRRRRYRRNLVGSSVSSFVQSVKNVVKVGAVAAVGFAAHRIGVNLLDSYVLTKIPIAALQTGKGAEVRRILGSVALAAIGALGLARVVPRYAGSLGGGMAVSAMIDTISRVANLLGQPQVAGYFAGYADAQGRAYGSYYSYQPGETFNGVGEYYEQMNGFGGPPMLQQAAAGMGSPMLQQAAAGMGEYYAQGAQGIGEFEQAAAGVGAPPGAHIELAPNLSEAEQALTISEAVASFGDIPGRMTVEPITYASPIPDDPGGSRAGIMSGPDGIFS